MGIDAHFTIQFNSQACDSIQIESISINWGLSGKDGKTEEHDLEIQLMQYSAYYQNAPV